MIDTVEKYNSLNVTSTLITKRGYYQVILNYYIDGVRKQKWCSLKLEDKPGNKGIAKRKQKELEQNFEKELIKKLEEDASSGETGINEEKNSILFGDYMLEWLKRVKHTVEITTYSSYNSKVKIIAKYFNNLEIKLIDLRKSHIKVFYNYLIEELGRKPQTVKRYHANIHKALDDAVELELIENNPADKMSLERSKQYISPYFKADELKKVFEIAKGSIIEPHILIASYLGLRRSEICSIKLSAIDFSNHTLTISHTVTQCNVDGKYTLVKKNRTKNNSSYRSLPLPPIIENKLIEIQERNEKNKKIFGNKYQNKEGYILVDDEGRLITPDRVTRIFRKLMIDNGFKGKGYHFHCLRHSFASILIQNGVPMKEVQLLLGHTNFSCTANIYSHVETNFDFAKNIEKILEENNSGDEKVAI